MSEWAEIKHLQQIITDRQLKSFAVVTTDSACTAAVAASMSVSCNSNILINKLTPPSGTYIACSA